MGGGGAMSIKSSSIMDRRGFTQRGRVTGVSALRSKKPSPLEGTRQRRERGKTGFGGKQSRNLLLKRTNGKVCILR